MSFFAQSLISVLTVCFRYSEILDYHNVEGGANGVEGGVPPEAVQAAQ